MVNQKIKLEDICFDFYSILYKGQQISEDAMADVLDDLLVFFTKKYEQGTY